MGLTVPVTLPVSICKIGSLVCAGQGWHKAMDISARSESFVFIRCWGLCGHYGRVMIQEAKTDSREKCDRCIQKNQSPRVSTCSENHRASPLDPSFFFSEMTASKAGFGRHSPSNSSGLPERRQESRSVRPQ